MCVGEREIERGGARGEAQASAERSCQSTSQKNSLSTFSYQFMGNPGPDKTLSSPGLPGSWCPNVGCTETCFFAESGDSTGLPRS